MRIYNQIMLEDEGRKVPLNIGDKLLVLTDGSYNEKKIIGTLEAVEIDDFLIVDGKEIPISYIYSIAKF